MPTQFLWRSSSRLPLRGESCATPKNSPLRSLDGSTASPPGWKHYARNWTCSSGRCRQKQRRHRRQSPGAGWLKFRFGDLVGRQLARQFPPRPHIEPTGFTVILVVIVTTWTPKSDNLGPKILPARVSPGHKRQPDPLPVLSRLRSCFTLRWHMLAVFDRNRVFPKTPTTEAE